MAPFPHAKEAQDRATRNWYEKAQGSFEEINKVGGDCNPSQKAER